MSRKGPVVDLQKLTDPANAEVAALLSALVGQADVDGKDLEAPRWPLRFIAAGEKSKGSTEV
jgi:hypothetical protein